MTSPNPMYASITPYFLEADSNLAANTEDQERVRAYNAYEDIYWNRPETFKLVQRGEDDQPIYLPSARKIIEATNRFLAVGWDYVVGNKRGTAAEQATTNEFLKALFKRERVYAKFSHQRRYGLIRGDSVWHIIGDKTKAEGRRLTIQDVTPAHYFPIFDKSDPDRRIGVHLVDQIPDPNDDTKRVARRQTYRRIEVGNGTYQVTSELGLYELGKWDDRYLDSGDINRLQLVRPEFVIEGITNIPVYHTPNFNHGSSVHFGSSEIRGIEAVMSSVNQSISDEALTLVMQGLGVYATNSGPAQDSEGNETEYEIGPRVVVEYPADGKFERISGVTSVAPMIEHMRFSLDEAQLGVGVPDIAAGKVDVAVAESGISLRLQLSPILAKNSEKEVEILGTNDQMIYDIKQEWLPAFEQFMDGTECDVEFKVDDPMPVNREAVIAEVMQLVAPPGPGIPALITLEMAIDRLRTLGWDYPASAVTDLRADAERLATVNAPDTSANRFEDELDEENEGQS